MGQAVIPDDFNDEYCCYSVEWPSSPQWLAVLRGVLTLPARGFFWDEKTGTVTQAQAQIRPTFDNNLHLEEVLMSCNEGTTSALNNIADAIFALANKSTSANCCDDPQTVINNSLVGYTTSPNSGDTVPIYGNQPIESVTPGEFPEGYEDLEAYNADKCAKANGIVDGIIVALNNLSNITAFNVGGLGALILLAVPGVLAFPPAAIPVMIGALITLSVAMHYLNDAADYIGENKNEWVCALYEGESTDTVIGVLSDLIDVMISALSVTSVIGFAIKSTILVLVSSNALNKLFTSQEAGYFPESDCECLHGYLWAFDADDENWEYEAITGVNPVPGSWNNNFGEGALETTVQPTDGNICEQQWSVGPLDFTVKGSELAVDLNCQLGVTLTMTVTYDDMTQDDDIIGNTGAGVSEQTLAINPAKEISSIDLLIGFDPASNTGYNFAVGILAVEVR